MNHWIAWGGRSAKEISSQGCAAWPVQKDGRLSTPYAAWAYVLFLNGIVPQDAALDADTLPKIKMPNRDGFVSAYPPPGRRRQALAGADGALRRGRLHR